MLLASDYAALLEHTRRMTFLDENQAALLTPDGIAIFDVDDRRADHPHHHRGRVVRRAGRAAGLPGLHEQGDPRAAARPAADRPRAHAPTPQRLADLIRDAEETHLVGCGTAAHAAMAGQYLLARVAGRRSFYANGSEFGYLEKFLGPGALAIALSQSGETIDVIDSVRGAKQRGATLAVAGERRGLDALPPVGPRDRCSAPARSAASSPPRASPPSSRSCC